MFLPLYIFTFFLYCRSLHLCTVSFSPCLSLYLSLHLSTCQSLSLPLSLFLSLSVYLSFSTPSCSYILSLSLSTPSLLFAYRYIRKHLHVDSYLFLQCRSCRTTCIRWRIRSCNSLWSSDPSYNNGHFAKHPMAAAQVMRNWPMQKTCQVDSN